MSRVAPIVNIETDPIDNVLNAAQFQRYDCTTQKSSVERVYKVTDTNSYATADKTSGFNKLYYLFKTVNYMSTQSFNIEFPLTVSIYSAFNPLSINFADWAWSDNGLLNFINFLRIYVGGQLLQRNECTELRVLKSIINNGRSDNDKSRVRGMWGLPLTQTNNFATFTQSEVYEQQTLENLAWLQNEPTHLQSFLTLLKSVSPYVQGTSGIRSEYAILGDSTVIYKYSGIVNVVLPLAYIFDFFDNNTTKLPPGLEIKMEMWTLLEEALMGIKPKSNLDKNASIGWATVKMQSDPTLYYLSNELHPVVDQEIQNYRISNPLKYNLTDYEEKRLTQKGPLISEAINIQQEYPISIKIRCISTVTSPIFDTAPLPASPNTAYVPQVTDYVVFPDSLSFYGSSSSSGEIDYDVGSPNMINYVRLLWGGEVVYEYLPTTQPAYGNILPSGQDYIFNNYSLKESYSKKYGSIGHIKPPTKSITGNLVNGELNLIYYPGLAEHGVKNSTENATNMMLQVSLKKALPNSMQLQVILAKPAQILIDGLNKVQKIVWPELSEENTLISVDPMLSS